MPGYLYEDLTPITTVGGFGSAMNIAFENIPSAGVKGYAATIGLYADWLTGTNTYATLNTTSKTIVGSINEAYQWDRGLYSGIIYYVTPRHANDLLKIKSNIYLGLIDAFSRTQFWNYESNSVIRLGSLQQDGDAFNITSEGSVFYGQNAQGDAMSNLDWGYARIKPYRIGLYNAKNAGYVGYLFRLDTQTNECYLRDNAGNKTFDFNRINSSLTISGTGSSSILTVKDGVDQVYLVANDSITNSVTSSGIVSTLWGINKYNAPSMIDNGLSLYFSQYYYDAISPGNAALGNIIFATETNWTSTASTRDGYFLLQNVLNGALNDVLRISSAGLGTLYGIWSYNSHPTFTADTQLVDKKYVDDLAGTQTPITEELTISSNGQTAFTLAQTPYTISYVNLFLNGQRRRYLVDFTVSGTSLIWNDPGGLTLKTTDSPLIVSYEY